MKMKISSGSTVVDEIVVEDDTNGGVGNRTKIRSTREEPTAIIYMIKSKVLKWVEAGK